MTGVREVAIMEFELKRTERLLVWFCARIPDRPENPMGGHPRADKHKAPAGIFWLLDNGAKWRALPERWARKAPGTGSCKDWYARKGSSGCSGRPADWCGAGLGYRFFNCLLNAVVFAAGGGWMASDGWGGWSASGGRFAGAGLGLRAGIRGWAGRTRGSPRRRGRSIWSWGRRFGGG